MSAIYSDMELDRTDGCPTAIGDGIPGLWYGPETRQPEPAYGVPREEVVALIEVLAALPVEPDE